MTNFFDAAVNKGIVHPKITLNAYGRARAANCSCLKRRKA